MLLGAVRGSRPCCSAPTREAVLGVGPHRSLSRASPLRILAIGLPGIILLPTTDPTDLADGLAQVLRLPSRVTLAALAATRLFGVMAGAGRCRARRARPRLGGTAAGRPLRVDVGQVFALLVLAIRRATVLATTMESRGFGAGLPRTWAREGAGCTGGRGGGRLRRADRGAASAAVSRRVPGTCC